MFTQQEIRDLRTAAIYLAKAIDDNPEAGLGERTLADRLEELDHKLSDMQE
jgi:hypothetical protein